VPLLVLRVVNKKEVKLQVRINTKLNILNMIFSQTSFELEIENLHTHIFVRAGK
jgi:hypothetical protein